MLSIVEQIEKFEFLLGLCIWFNILHVVNIASKYLQTENMQIDIATTQLKNLISFFEKYEKPDLMMS